MATAETVQLGPAHPPKEDSITVFKAIEHDLKRTLQHLRHETNKHEPSYFAPVSHLSDHHLTSFTSHQLHSVRLATSAYGLHLFGKIHIPEPEGAEDNEKKFIMFRAFIPSEGEPERAKFHCLHMEEKDNGNEKVFKAIFGEADELVWFDE